MLRAIRWWLLDRLLPENIVLVHVDDLLAIAERTGSLEVYVEHSGAMTHPKRIKAYSRLLCGLADMQADIKKMERGYTDA